MLACSGYDRGADGVDIGADDADAVADHLRSPAVIVEVEAEGILDTASRCRPSAAPATSSAWPARRCRS